MDAATLRCCARVTRRPCNRIIFVSPRSREAVTIPIRIWRQHCPSWLPICRPFIGLSPGIATVNFSPPSNNGGSTIVGYAVTCTADGQVTRAAFASASPIFVNGLRGGVFYTCAVTATNSGGLTSGSSESLNVTTTPAADIAVLFLLLLDRDVLNGL